MDKARKCKEIYASILQNLDLQPDPKITIAQLCTEKIYCKLIQIMFPFLQKEIQALSQEKNPVGEKLQGLVEFLSYPILTMDLSHISGNSIANGNLDHLHNFLQILLPLSQAFKKQNNSSYHSEEEFNIESQHNSDYDQDQLSDISRQYSAQSEGYSSRAINSRPQQSNSHKKHPKNNKGNQLKAIEENLMPVTQKQPRILTNDPKITTKLQKQSSSRKQSDSTLKQDSISEVDLEFLQQVDQEQLEQLPEDHEVVQKYMRELQKIELLKMQQQSGGNIDDLIDVQIQIVKDSLKKMRSQAPVDEKETIDQLLKNKNAYKLFLKDYLKTYDGNKKKQSEQKQKVQQNQFRKVTKLKKEKEDLQKEFENEHLSMYYKMRDEKLNYLRKIHRIIFELEKRKIIDEKKDHLQVRRQQNVVARNALSSIENAYNDKISMLKEKLQSERKERHQASQAQKEILSKLERELRQDKLKQISELKDMWKQEKERFDYMIKDDGDLERQILQIYKKY